jgi:hypothetical protein
MIRTHFWSVFFLSVLLAGCSPRIELSTPTQPITINMNVKIEHDITIKADKDVDDMLKNNSQLF